MEELVDVHIVGQFAVEGEGVDRLGMSYLVRNPAKLNANTHRQN